MDYIGYHAGKIALVSKEKNRIEIRAFSEFEGDVKQLYKDRTELVTGLKTQEVLLRSLTLKLKSKREVMATLPFQVETLIPYDEEEAILLPTLYKGKEETEVFLLASSKKTVASHLEGLDFDPDRISCVPLALYRFARHFFPKVDNLFFHHEDIFVVISGGRIQSAHGAKPQEMGRISAYLHKKYPDVDHFFSSSSLEEFSHLKPLFLEKEELGHFATPIGLALDGAFNDHESAQFRQGKLASPNKQKRLKKQLTTFGAVCAAFCLCVLVMGQCHLKKRERAILSTLAAPQGTSLSRYAEQLERSVYEKRSGKIVVSTMPKVSEVLTWLSTHPKLDEECSITHFRYQMVRAPKLGSSARKFEAKVELELTTQNPRTARAFHEALLHDRGMVNQKMDVKWSADHGIYRATFYLKENRLG